MFSKNSLTVNWDEIIGSLSYTSLSTVQCDDRESWQLKPEWQVAWKTLQVPHYKI